MNSKTENMNRNEIYQLMGLTPKGILVQAVKITSWGQQLHLQCFYDPDRRLEFEIIFKNCRNISWDVTEENRDLTLDRESDVIYIFIGNPNYQQEGVILTDMFCITVLYETLIINKNGG